MFQGRASGWRGGTRAGETGRSCAVGEEQPVKRQGRRCSELERSVAEGSEWEMCWQGMEALRFETELSLVTLKTLC